MGLFGGQTVLVASTVYNMAGPVEGRPEFLKSTVSSNIISNTRFSMSETISKAYINGPGIRARNFVRWAQSPTNGYLGIGVPDAEIGYVPELDLVQVRNQIPNPDLHSLEIQEVRTEPTRPKYWAQQYIMATYPDRLNTGWTFTYDSASNSMTITWEDATTTTFSPVGIVPDSDYYYITYVDKSSAAILSKMWIYRIGDGNAVLDAVPTKTSFPGLFWPYIPIRVDGHFLSDTHHPDAYALAKKAYKKATGQKFDKLVDKLEDNDDLDDIDHAFVVYGVALNCYEQEGRKYLFKFFESMIARSQWDLDDFTLWQNNVESYQAAAEDYDTQRGAYFDSGGGIPPPVADDPAITDGLTYPAYPVRPINSIDITANGALLDTKCHFRIHWFAIKKFTGAGLLKPDAKKDEIWLETGETYDAGSLSLQYSTFIESMELPGIETLYIKWQVDEDSWEMLQIIGLEHQNLIYKDKAVTITAAQALADADESGFIVPLHYDTVRSMSLIDSTQLQIGSCYLVLNSFDIVKQKWYQTTIFKIVVVIAIVAITVATGGVGGTSVGLLGTNAAVGTALGFTGFAAVVVGAVANAIAAMILTQLISLAANKIFGPKLGAIISVIASVIAINIGTGLLNGQSMAQVWGNLMSASNIINMTSAVGNGIAGYVQASAMDIVAQTQKIIKDYEADSKKYTEQYLKEFGYGTFDFDPNILTGNFVMETMDQFMGRTLMTGMDIAEMTNDMLSSFTDLTLDLSTLASQ
jgi:hypothetical protein